MSISPKKQLMDEAYADWQKDQTPARMTKLLSAATPVLQSAVTTYVGSNDPVALSRAKLLAMRAFPKYDKKKAKLRTFLLIQLQPLRRFAANRRYLMRIPQEVQQLSSGVNEAGHRLQEKFGREATDEELSDATGLSLKRLNYVRRLLTAETSESSYASPMAVSTPSLADPYVDWTYASLDPLGKKIMEHRMGYRGKPVLPTNVLAKKIGISPSAITQRATRIAGMIEAGTNNGSK